MGKSDEEALYEETERLLERIDRIDEAMEHNPIIDRMNQEHAVVMVGGKCLVMNEIIDPAFNRPDISFSTPTDFKNRYANKKIPNPENPDKNITHGDLWLNSIYRRQFKGIVFDPGATHPGYYNLWRGFDIQPVRGDWALFRNHIFNIIAKNDESTFWWIINWMARILRDPGGEKPGTSIVLKGKQGTGKGIFVDTFGALFGRHYIKIAQASQVTGRFNQHLKDALLVFVDEGFWAGDKQAEGVIKNMITEKTINIEPKGKDVITVKNHMNLIIASNNEWVVPASLEERRFFVTDLSEEKMQDTEYFNAMINQMNNGGLSAMMYDLLYWNNIPYKDLRKIPRTEALFDQIYNSMSVVKKFWYEKLQEGTLSANHDGWKGQIPFQELYSEYLAFAKSLNDRHPKSKQQLGKELKSLCKNIRNKKSNYGGKRVNEKLFPTLVECRKEFEILVRMENKIPWEDDTNINPVGHNGVVM